MDWLSSGERNWRYLVEPATNGGSFSSLLKELRISLPSGISLQELVRFGWIRPVLRIRIPDEFYLAWKSYPVLQFDNPEDVGRFGWVFRLYGISDSHFRYGGWAGGPPPANWYEHPLDDRAHPGIEEILQRVIEVDQNGEEPAPVTHPRGWKIRPWIDLFAYWQAYHVAELMRAVPLCQPILNVPDAPSQIHTMAEQYASLKKFSDDWIRSINRRWRERAPVFEWVSRYRTALGYWVGTDLDVSHVEAAGRQIASAAGLNPDRIQTQIRDCLLVLWKDLEWRYQGDPIPTAVRELLRQDILRAVELLVSVERKTLDPDDEFWEPADRQPREWARLSEVLPFENQEARRSFSVRAPLYLDRLNQMLMEAHRLTSDKVRAIVRSSWAASAPFQRFCLAFERLHRHFGDDAGSHHQLDLRESTPVDYLLLCALFAEKILLNLHMANAPMGSEAPRFRDLIKRAADRLGNAFGIQSLSTRIPWDQTALYDLPIQKGNPFSTGKGMPRNNLAETLAAEFFDFVVIRNYAAHHDCIDDELVYRAWGRDPLEALLGITLLTLS